MFRGRHELSIDPKGRLAIPAKFRDVLSKKFADEDDEARFVVSLDNGERLLIYPECEWEKVEQQLLDLNVNGRPELQAYQNLLLHNAETLELDSAGRVLIPANLRQLVGLDKDVTLVGRVNRLELWRRESQQQGTLDAINMYKDALNAALSETDLRL